MKKRLKSKKHNKTNAFTIIIGNDMLKTVKPTTRRKS